MTTTSFNSQISYSGYAERKDANYSAMDQAEWDDLHDGNGTDSGSSIYAGWWSYASWHDVLIQRGFIAFDTSSLPDNATISSAYLEITGNEYTSGGYLQDFIIGSASVGSSIADSDYQGHVSTTNYGTWSHGTGGAFTNDTVALNSSGYNSISKTGVTVFSVRIATDVSDTMSWNPDDYNYITITQGSSSKLYVTYTAPEPIEEELTETVTATDSILKATVMILSDVVTAMSMIVGHGMDYLKTLTDTVIASESFSVARGFQYILTETVTLVEEQIKRLNGKIVDIWAKAIGIVSSWTKTAGVTDTTWSKTESINDTTWTDTATQIDTSWNKGGKPE